MLLVTVHRQSVQILTAWEPRVCVTAAAAVSGAASNSTGKPDVHVSFTTKVQSKATKMTSELNAKAIYFEATI